MSQTGCLGFQVNTKNDGLEKETGGFQASLDGDFISSPRLHGTSLVDFSYMNGSFLWDQLVGRYTPSSHGNPSWV